MALEYPADLKYIDTHEYLRVEDDVITVGITAYAVDQLGDVVFVGLPDEGEQVTKGDSFGSVESVKAVEDLHAPVTGEVIAVNAAVVDSPESIADDPYGDGWMIKIRLSNPDDLDETMTAESYASMVEGS